jgi:hypothetical protein
VKNSQTYLKNVFEIKKNDRVHGTKWTDFNKWANYVRKAIKCLLKETLSAILQW